MDTIVAPAHHPTVAARRADEALLERFNRTRDPALRERLVERYLPLARFAASKFARGTEPFEDLQQVASLGLLKAIDRFDPDNGAAFSSFAMPTMDGELRRYFRDRGWNIRPPRDLLEDALRVERAARRLETRGQHAATIEDLARETDLSVEEVLDAREALNARHATSLSSPGREDDDGHTTLEDRLGTDDPEFGRAEERATLDALTRVLPPRDRRIVELRFVEDLTQVEIGERVGLSQMHVSRILRDALAKLRHAAEDAGAGAGAPTR
jgi:RNA polymerase sigma-B factor